MKIHLRADESNAVHTKFTVFINGQNTGQLCFGTEEFHTFHLILALGVKSPLDEFVSSGHVYIKPEESSEGE